jgi:TrmH family RNA methyltransferase
VSTQSTFENLRVVLVATRNALNIGAAARAMSNFGFFNLCVVNPYEPSFREARSAVGAADLLAHARLFNTVAEAVADCTLVVGTTAVGTRERRHPIERLEEAARVIRKRLTSSRVAILFGSEKFGLSNDDLSHCNWLLRIPTREDHRSMNLGQAVAVCLYELARSSKAISTAKPDVPRSATAGDIDRVASLLLDALRLSGSLKTRSPTHTEEKLRRLMRRHNLTAEDAKFWLGMFRQIVYTLNGGTNADVQPAARG